MSGTDTIITMGGRRGRKVSKLLSLHVENEGPVKSLRYRRPRVAPLSPPVQTVSPGDSTWSQEETPHHLSTDSGYMGDSTPPGSEPDWFFRPAGKFHAKYEGLELRKSWRTKIRELFGMERPNYVDYHSPQWFFRTEAILYAIIAVIVLACLGFCLMLSVKLFHNVEMELNGKYKSIQFAAEKQAMQGDVSLPGVEIYSEMSTETLPFKHLPRNEEVDAITNQNKLSSEKAKEPKIEVIDLMKEDVILPVVNQKTPGSGTVRSESRIVSKNKIEAENPKKFQEEKKIRLVKTKNRNPLTVAVKPVKMSKAKVKSPTAKKVSPKSLDYPDDPKFRGKKKEFLDYPDDPTFRGKNEELLDYPDSSL